MKPSIKLDPKQLKLYRTQRRLTQAEMATRAIDLVANTKTRNDNRPRMYQKIEETGVTSPKRAARIAAELGVAVDDLKDDAHNLQTLWWISDPFSDEPALGSTFYGSFGVMSEIEKLWKVQRQCFLDHAQIFGSLTTTKKKLIFEFSQQEHARTLSIVLRPCSFLTESGLIWRDIDDLEEEYFLPSIRSFIFRNCHIVTLDGRRFPPEGAEPCYQVEVSSTSIESNAVTHFKGSKHFNTQREFYLSLDRWLNNYEAGKVEIS